MKARETVAVSTSWFGLPDNEFRVLGLLASCCDERFVSRPSNAWLAAEMNALPSTVDRTLRALERRGLIERRPDRVAGRSIVLRGIARVGQGGC